jgi:hypothetical protein
VVVGLQNCELEGIWIGGGTLYRLPEEVADEGTTEDEPSGDDGEIAEGDTVVEAGEVEEGLVEAELVDRCSRGPRRT